MPEGSDKLLIQLIQDMAELKTLVRGYADLELRVRELERSRWSSAWLIGILSAAISSGVVALIVKLVANV